MGKQLIAVEMPGVTPPVPGDVAITGFSPPNPALLTKPGAVLFSVDFGRPTPHVGFSMEFDVTLSLTAAGPLSRLGVMQGLTKLRDEVDGTLNLFQHLM